MIQEKYQPLINRAYKVASQLEDLNGPEQEYSDCIFDLLCMVNPVWKPEYVEAQIEMMEQLVLVHDLK